LFALNANSVSNAALLVSARTMIPLASTAMVSDATMVVQAIGIAYLGMQGATGTAAASQLTVTAPTLLALAAAADSDATATIIGIPTFAPTVSAQLQTALTISTVPRLLALASATADADLALTTRTLIDLHASGAQLTTQLAIAVYVTTRGARRMGLLGGGQGRRVVAGQAGGAWTRPSRATGVLGHHLTRAPD
jgi:hypothetical protein